MADTIDASEAEVLACAGTFPWWSVLLWGICAVIIGILFLTTPVITTIAMITMIGAWWFVGGIFSLISLTADRSHLALKVITAILSLIAGLVILAYPLFSTLVYSSVFCDAHCILGYSYRRNTTVFMDTLPRTGDLQRSVCSV